MWFIIIIVIVVILYIKFRDPTPPGPPPPPCPNYAWLVQNEELVMKGGQIEVENDSRLIGTWHCKMHGGAFHLIHSFDGKVCHYKNPRTGTSWSSVYITKDNNTIILLDNTDKDRQHLSYPNKFQRLDYRVLSNRTIKINKEEYEKE